MTGPATNSRPFRRRPESRIAALALTLVLAGCLPPDFKLIDQRTFWPPHAPGTAELARADLPALPLVTIRYDQPDLDYAPALAQAVEDAEAHKPNVEFDVIAPIPTGATAEVQDQFRRQGAEDTQAVANALGSAGVSMDRVHLGFRGDSGSPPREVLIYVR